MFDILAAIQSADPPSLVLWSLFAFAAGMYPLGFMLGSSCSACCNPCGLCETGSLPDTVTVTFNNFHEKTVGFSSVYFQPLNQFSSCFGGGAEGIVTAPVGDPETDKGPITGVLLTNPGSGYAKLGREAPTLTVSGGSGTGLAVTPTVTATNDACGIPTWSVTAVKFSGGTGYANGEALTVMAQAGDTTKAAAVLTVQTDPRSQPTLSASVSGGTGATLTPTLAANGTTPQTWGVASVSVSGTTSGYTDGAAVTFSYGANVTEQTKATAVIKTVRTTPTITASVSGGSGASLTVTLSQSPTTPSDTALWHVDAVNVANGGTGYANGDPVTFAVSDGTQVTAASGTIVVADRQEPELNDIVAIRAGAGGTYDFYYGGASITANMTPTYEGGLLWWQPTTINILDGGSGYEVGDLFLWAEPYPTLDGSTPNPAYDPTIFSDPDSFWVVTGVDGNGAITSAEQDTPGLYYQTAGNGAIQSVTITSGGDYYKPTSEISRVVVTNPGQYYYYTGVPTGVTITNGGQYYREDASLPPYVATVTGNIAQGSPSSGTGAVITAIIDSNTSSPNFGRAVGLNIDDGGDGYLAAVLGETSCCGQHWNGRSVVLKRGSGGESCWYSHRMCGGFSDHKAAGRVRLEYNGPLESPFVRIKTELSNELSANACDADFHAPALPGGVPYDCSNLAFTAVARAGGVATASVTPGGEYVEDYLNPGGLSCASCCKGSGEVPQEIAIEITGSTISAFDGVYVRSVISINPQDGVHWGNYASSNELMVLVSLEPSEACTDCDSHCRVYVNFQHPTAILLANNYTNSPDAPAERCVSVPICNPYGTYTLCSYYYNNQGVLTKNCEFTAEVGPA